MKKIFLFLLSGILMAAELSLPVVESANYLIKFNRNAGIYELYYRDRASNRLINLLGAPNPHTDYISISLDGELYTLGRDERYLAPVQKRLQVLSNGGAIKWLLPYQIDVTQYLRIIDQQPLVSYVKMDIVIDNRSSINRSIGLFQLYDLNKANSGAPAFSVPEGEVYRESFYQGSSIPSYVRTSYDFYLYFDIRGTTRPQRLTLAQWRKIHDAGWNYAFSLNKQGFGYNLYDTNSPALGVYYDPRPLMSGQSRIYTSYLSRQLLVEPKETTADQPLAQPPTVRKPAIERKIETPSSEQEHITTPNTSQQFNEQILNKISALEEKLDAWQKNQKVVNKEQPAVKLESTTETLGKVVNADQITKVHNFNYEKKLYLSQKQRFFLLEKLQQQLSEKLKNGQQQLLQLSTHYRLSDYKPSLSDIQLLIEQARKELAIWDGNYLRLMSVSKEDNNELTKLHTLLASTRSSLDQDYLSWQSLYNLLNVIDMQQFNSLSLEHILEEFNSTLHNSRKKYQVLADLQRYNYGVAERLPDPNLSRFYSEFARLISAQRHYLSTGVELLEQWDNFLRGEVKSWLGYQKQSEQLYQLFSEVAKSLDYHEKSIEATKSNLYLVSQLFSTLDLWNENNLKGEQKSPIIDISIQEKEVRSLIQQLDSALESSTEKLAQMSAKLDKASENLSVFRRYFAFQNQAPFLLTQWQVPQEQGIKEDSHLRLNDKMADTYKQPLYPLNEDKLYSSLDKRNTKHLIEAQPNIDDREEYEPEKRQNTITMGAPIFTIQPQTPRSLSQHSIFDSSDNQEENQTFEERQEQSNAMDYAVTSQNPKRLTPPLPQALTGQPQISQRESKPNNETIIQGESSFKGKKNYQFARQFEQPQTSVPLSRLPLTQAADDSHASLPNRAEEAPSTSLPNAVINSISPSTAPERRVDPLTNSSFSNKKINSTSIPNHSSSTNFSSDSKNMAQQLTQVDTGESLEEAGNQDLLLQELLKNSEQVLTHPYSFDPRKVARIRQIWQKLQEEEP